MSGLNLEYIKGVFPDDFVDISELLDGDVYYLDTSAVNYMIDNFDIETILNTSMYLSKVKKYWICSPVQIWETMLNSDDVRRKKIIFCMQNLMYKRMYASPADMVIRYIMHSYPRKSIDYSFLNNTEIGRIWFNMKKNKRKTFKFNFDDLKFRTSFIYELSKK